MPPFGKRFPVPSSLAGFPAHASRKHVSSNCIRRRPEASGGTMLWILSLIARLSQNGTFRTTVTEPLDVLEQKQTREKNKKKENLHHHHHNTIDLGRGESLCDERRHGDGKDGRSTSITIPSLDAYCSSCAFVRMLWVKESPTNPLPPLTT